MIGRLHGRERPSGRRGVLRPLDAVLGDGRQLMSSSWPSRPSSLSFATSTPWSILSPYLPPVFSSTKSPALSRPSPTLSPWLSTRSSALSVRSSTASLDLSKMPHLDLSELVPEVAGLDVAAGLRVVPTVTALVAGAETTGATVGRTAVT